MDSNLLTCSLTYSSFTDIITNEHTCVWLSTSGANLEIKSCNIIRNKQVNQNSQGIISTYGNLRIEYSCILENRAKCIFYQVNSNYKFTLSNCTANSTSNNGYMTTQNTVTLLKSTRESVILSLCY
mgnify:CR=1 FL=1